MDIFKRYLLKRKIQREGGERISSTLRQEVRLKHKVDVGMHSYGSCFCDEFNLGGEVSIGRYTSFGPNVHYFGANHPMEYASMSPYFYQKSWSGGELIINDIARFKLEVGNDCWIGYGTVITCNCQKIGNGAVIGAGSIVTKNVEPYSIVAGNPAKIIRYRFDEEVIRLLEKSKWYELEPDVLLKFYDYVDSPEIFAKKIMAYQQDK